jgi:hypothetical protein
VPGDDEVREVEGALADLVEALFAADTVEGTLQELVALAKASLEACDGAGVLLLRKDGSSVSLAESGDLIRELDRAQLDTGEGPGLEAAASGEAVVAADLSTEGR